MNKFKSVPYFRLFFIAFFTLGIYNWGYVISKDEFVIPGWICIIILLLGITMNLYQLYKWGKDNLIQSKEIKK